jgi:hypothetical protein
MQQHCYDPSKPIGVEWDWLNFFWGVNANKTPTSQRTYMQHLYEIQKVACGGKMCTSTDEITWNKLLEGAKQVHGLGSPRYGYFQDMGDVYGVFVQ